MKYTFNIITENKPGVLYRLVNVFYKRKINISAVQADETENKNISVVKITAGINSEMVGKIKKQIEKIIEVVSVNENL
jgi:acetolactate synthase-1/3 small subunit